MLPKVKVFCKTETPKERLDFLVKMYNGMEYKPTTNTNLKGLLDWGTEIDSILKRFPELGPVTLKQYKF